MSNRGTIVMIAAAASMGCLAKAPSSTDQDLGDAGCAGTKSGAACLTLVFTVAESVRAGDAARCDGNLHWGLYTGGDVGLFGPGSNRSVAGGTCTGVDLSAENASYALTLPDLPAGSYQILGFINETTATSAVSGDPVTFPSNAFEVPPDQHTITSVVFDYVR